MLKQRLFYRFLSRTILKKWHNKNCINMRLHFCITDNSHMQKGILNRNGEKFSSPNFTQTHHRLKIIFLASTRNYLVLIHSINNIFKSNHIVFTRKITTI